MYPLPKRGETVATDATILASIPHAERVLSIKPRRTAYRHKAIIVVHNDVGTLETGETVTNLPVFAGSMPAHIWVTTDPGRLLDILCARFREDPAWNYQLMQSDNGAVTFTRLSRFGYRPPGRRRAPMHIVWSPADMMRDATRLLLPNDPASVMRFALDIRDWLQESDLPIPSTLTGIAAALLRDKRFYPEARGRVPRATNERLREFLPGVHQEIHAPTNIAHRQLVALDQTRAYHRTVQEVPLPDSTSMYARGHYGNPAEAPVWIRENDPRFETVLAMPGIVCVDVVSRRTGKGEHRPPCLDFTGERRIYLWSSEIEFARKNCDARIVGIIASWSSPDTDKGLPRYGEWAERQIVGASAYRLKWLKPTLHSLYGLLGANRRGFKTGWRIAKGRRKTWLLGPREVTVSAIEFPATQPATVHIAQLGVIQAAIRTRTMGMARTLAAAGMRITHLHADGLHAEGDLPLIPESHWRVETRDNLTYLDRVSWTCDDGDVLPGRDMRDRVNHRRHNADVLIRTPNRSRWRPTKPRS